MYIPTRYRVTDDDTIDAFLAANGFATLVTSGPGGLMATHLPVEFERGEDGARLVQGHVAKGNPQWRELEHGEPLLIVLGPHTYVTPTWYDHPNVPTWNYQAVHCSGPVRLVSDRAEQLRMVRRLAEHYEPPGSPPPRFDVDAMPAGLRDAELKGIVAFEMRVTQVEAAFKLSQNRHTADHARITRELMARPDDGSRAVARAMAADHRARYGRDPLQGASA